MQADLTSMRDMAYGLEANLDAIALGLTPYANWTVFADNLIGNFDSWCRVGVLNMDPTSPAYPDITASKPMITSRFNALQAVTQVMIVPKYLHNIFKLLR